MKIFLNILIAIISPLAFSQSPAIDSLNAARLSYKKGNFVKAYQQYQSAEKLGAKKEDYQDEMAQSAYKAEQYADAENYFEDNAKREKSVLGRADNYFNQGNAQMKQQSYANAVESYKQTLRLNPEDEEARYNLSEALRQLKKQQSGENNDPNEAKSENNNGDPKDNNSPPEKNDGQLEDNSIERTLDKLMRKEKETKEELNKTHQSSSGSSSKDW